MARSIDYKIDRMIQEAIDDMECPLSAPDECSISDKMFDAIFDDLYDEEVWQ